MSWYKRTEEKNTPLFLDKKVITAMIIDKEGLLIGEYASLINKIRSGVIKQASKSPEYERSWSILHELYQFLRFNKIEKMKEKFKPDYDAINEIMGRYDNLESGEINIDDLQKGVAIIQRIISLAGYHEDETKMERDYEFASDELE